VIGVNILNFGSGVQTAQAQRVIEESGRRPLEVDWDAPGNREIDDSWLTGPTTRSVEPQRAIEPGRRPLEVDWDAPGNREIDDSWLTRPTTRSVEQAEVPAVPDDWESESLEADTLGTESDDPFGEADVGDEQYYDDLENEFEIDDPYREGEDFYEQDAVDEQYAEDIAALCDGDQACIDEEMASAEDGSEDGSGGGSDGKNGKGEKSGSGGKKKPPPCTGPCCGVPGYCVELKEPILKVNKITGLTGADLINKGVQTIYAWMASTLGFVCVLVIVISGGQIMFGGMSSEAVSLAKTRIMTALASLILLFFIALILKTVNPGFFVAGG